MVAPRARPVDATDVGAPQHRGRDSTTAASASLIAWSRALSRGVSWTSRLSSNAPSLAHFGLSARSLPRRLQSRSQHVIAEQGAPPGVGRRLCPRWHDFPSPPRCGLFRRPRGSRFTTATETIGYAAFGPIGRGSRARRVHPSLRRARSSSQHTTPMERWDASEARADHRADPCAAARRRLEYVTLEMAKDLAARIPERAARHRRWQMEGRRGRRGGARRDVRQ